MRSAVAVAWTLLWLAVCTHGLTLIRRSHKDADEAPIITGCLRECGSKEQSCVTQCQVCVEQNACDSLLRNCSTCLQETHSLMRHLFNSDKTVQDNGGKPLRHEGIRQDLHGARLKAIDAKRHVRKARTEVLTAQRQVEWAIEERREAADALRKAEKKLHRQEKHAKGWRRQSSARLQDMRKQIREAEKQAKSTERQIKVLKRRMANEERLVSQAEDSAQRGARAQEVMVMDRVMTRLKSKLQVQQYSLKHQREALKKEEREQHWFSRGLNDEVDIVAKGVRAQIQTLRTARLAETDSQQQLQEAKDKYRTTAEASQEFNEFVRDLEVSLAKNPMPDFLPESVKGFV